MKQIDWIFAALQSPLLVAWLVTAKNGLQFFLATSLTVVTILYFYEKWKRERLERKKLERELNDK